MVSGSLQSLTELLTNQSFLPSDPQWGNYVTAWVEGDLGTYLRNSVIYTGAAVLGILLVSSLAGYALARLEFAGKGAFTFVILAVMIIPAPAMFLAQYKLLISLGLTNNPVGYVLILITSGIPMSTLIMRSFFVSQPRDLEEAAALDGAGPLRVFWSVILPLARPGLAAVAVIQGLGAWNEYLMALVSSTTTSSCPSSAASPRSFPPKRPSSRSCSPPTTISIVPVIVFYLMAQRHIVKGIGAGALK